MAFENIGKYTTNQDDATLVSPIEKGTIEPTDSSKELFENLPSIRDDFFVASTSPINIPNSKVSNTGRVSYDNKDTKQFSYGYGYLREAAKGQLTPKDLSYLGNPDDYNNYNVRLSGVGNPNRERANNQRWYTQLGNSLVQSVVGEIIGGTVQGVGNTADIVSALYKELNGENYNWENDPNGVSQLGKAIMDYSRELAPIHTREEQGGSWDVGDSGWWFNGVTSAASTLGLLAPGLGTAAAVNKFGQLARLGARTSAALRAAGVANAAGKVEALATFAQAGISGLTMRNAENFRESMETASEVKDNTLNKFNNYSDEEFEKFKEDNPLIIQKYRDRYGDVNPNRDELSDFAASLAGWRAYQVNGANLMFDIVQSIPAVNISSRLFNKWASGSVKAAQRSTLKSLANSTVAASRRTTKDFLSDTFRFGSILGVENLSEGIEEAINFIGGQEGLAYANHLLGEENEGIESRLKDYVKDPELYESAFWGVVGGVLFGAARPAFGKVYNKVVNGGDVFYDDNTQRIDEIAAWKIKLDNLTNTIGIINSGKNPYVKNESGYVNLDSSGDIEIIKDELRNRVYDEVILDMAIDAGKVGNGNLLKDRFLSNDTRQFFIDNDLSTPEGYTILNKKILNNIDNARKAFDFFNDKINPNEDNSIKKILATKAVRDKLSNNLITKDKAEYTKLLIQESDPSIYPIFDNQNIDAEVKNALYIERRNEVQNAIDNANTTTLQGYLTKQANLSYLKYLNDNIDKFNQAGINTNLNTINGYISAGAISNDYLAIQNKLADLDYQIIRNNSNINSYVSNTNSIAEREEREIKRAVDSATKLSKDVLNDIFNNANTIAELDTANQKINGTSYDNIRKFLTNDEIINAYDKRRRSIEKRMADEAIETERITNKANTEIANYDERFNSLNTKEELDRLKQEIKDSYSSLYGNNISESTIAEPIYNSLLDRIDNKILSLTKITEQSAKKESVKNRKTEISEIRSESVQPNKINKLQSNFRKLKESNIGNLESVANKTGSNINYESGIYDITNPSTKRKGEKYLFVYPNGNYIVISYLSSFNLYGIEPVNNEETIKDIASNLGIKIGEVKEGNILDSLNDGFNTFINGTKPVDITNETNQQVNATTIVNDISSNGEDTENDYVKEQTITTNIIESHTESINKEAETDLKSNIDDILVNINASSTDRILGERLSFIETEDLKSNLNDDVKLIENYAKAFGYSPNKKGIIVVSFLDFMNYVANEYGQNIAINALFYNRMLNLFKYANSVGTIYTYENLNNEEFIKAINPEAIYSPSKFLHNYNKSNIKSFNNNLLNSELEVYNKRIEKFDRGNNIDAPLGSIVLPNEIANQLEVLSNIKQGDKVDISINENEFYSNSNVKVLKQLNDLNNQFNKKVAKGENVADIAEQIASLSKKVNEMFTIKNNVPISISYKGTTIGNIPNIFPVLSENGTIDSNAYIVVSGLRSYLRPTSSNSYFNYADYLYTELNKEVIDSDINDFIENIVTIGLIRRNIINASSKERKSFNEQIQTIKNELENSPITNKIIEIFGEKDVDNYNVVNHIINVINYNGLYTKGYTNLKDSLLEWGTKLNRDTSNAYSFKVQLLNELKSSIVNGKDSSIFQLEISEINDGTPAVGRDNRGNYVYSNIREIFGDNFNIVNNDEFGYNGIFNGRTYKLNYQTNIGTGNESIIVETKTGNLLLRTQRNTLGNNISNTANSSRLRTIKNLVIRSISSVISETLASPDIVNSQSANALSIGLKSLFDNVIVNQSNTTNRVGVNNEIQVSIGLTDTKNGTVTKLGNRLDIFFHNGSARGSNGYVNVRYNGKTYTTKEGGNSRITEVVSQKEIENKIIEAISRARFNILNDVNKLSFNIERLNNAFGFDIEVSPNGYSNWLVDNNILMTEATSVYNEEGRKVSNFTPYSDNSSSFNYNISLKLDVSSGLQNKFENAVVVPVESVEELEITNSMQNDIKNILSNGTIGNLIEYLQTTLRVSNRYDFVYKLVEPMVKLNTEILESDDAYFLIEPISGNISLTTKTLTNIQRTINSDNELIREDTIRKLTHEFIHKILYATIDSKPEIADAFYNNIEAIKNRIIEYTDDIKNGIITKVQVNNQLGDLSYITDTFGENGRLRQFINTNDRISSQELIVEALTNASVAGALAMIPNRNNNKRRTSNLWQRLIDNIVRTIKSLLNVKRVTLKNTALESILIDLNTYAPISLKTTLSRVAQQESFTQEGRDNEGKVEKDLSKVVSPLEESITDIVNTSDSSSISDINDLSNDGLLFSSSDDVYSFDDIVKDLSKSEVKLLNDNLKNEKFVVSCRK